MEIIEELGMRPVGSKGAQKAWALYECSNCGVPTEGLKASVKRVDACYCSNCIQERMVQRAKLMAVNQQAKAAESYTSRATEVHKGFYTYNNIAYTGSSNPIVITCSIHGDFSQRASDHLSGYGCPACSLIKRTKNTEEFIEEALVVNKGLYSYDNVEYTSSKTPVVITCRTHGDFLQEPTSHLQGRGCMQCRNHRPTKTTIKFIQEAAAVHNGTYTYSEVEYLGCGSKVVITCPVHGNFEQIPSGHLRGQGCIACGFERSNIAKRINSGRPTILYYVHLPKYRVWKVGCTVNLDDVTKRFKTIDGPIDVLMVRTFEYGGDAYKLEAQILQQFKEYQYQGSKLLKSKGNSELFNKDIIIELVDYIGTTVNP